MDVHFIGYIGMWVTLAALVLSIPLGLWWMSFFTK